MKHLSTILMTSLASALLFASCQALAPAATVTPTRPAPTRTPTVIPSPTPIPERLLVVCMGQEPNTLYLYGGASQAMWSVLEAVYDGPVDTRQFMPQPVILEKVPVVNSGDAAIQPAEVKAGDYMIDADGKLAALSSGVRVKPSGCNASDCAVAWDGKSALQMDRVGMIFKLKAGLKWSNGAPLKASDSIFSYQVARDSGALVSRDLLERTGSYRALDDNTVEWVGIPGFYPARFETLFWLPLPQHQLGQIKASDLPQNEDAAKRPLGWGPYMIQEWTAGDHITLLKNPNYWRAAEGLPKFDRLVYRFVGRTGGSAQQALQNGECDVVDRSVGLEEDLQNARKLEIEKKIKLAVGQGPDWEQMVFNIAPASSSAPRPHFFEDVRTRQAIAFCMDRPRIVKDILFAQSSIPNSFLPPTHPLYLKDLPQPAPFDPATGIKMLEEIGWTDQDNNPATPRQASAVKGVPDGTFFSIEYATTGARLRRETVQILTESLAQCGIQLTPKFVDPQMLYAGGPAGEVFGRQFTVAQLAWKAGAELPCPLYLSSQIPSDKNRWLGVNVTGYNSPAFDSACLSALSARPDQQAQYLQWSQEAQKLFVQDAPAVPLYFRVNVAATRPDFCGLQMDVSARSDFWNLESFDYGTCPTP